MTYGRVHALRDKGKEARLGNMRLCGASRPVMKG